VRTAPLSYRTAPTWFPLLVNSRASTTASSAATLSLERPGGPAVMEADRSRTSHAVSSRSSVKTRSCGSFSRAVTFQSMCRASSPSR